MTSQREESEGSKASFSVGDVIPSLLRQITTETMTEGYLRFLPHIPRGRRHHRPEELALDRRPQHHNPFHFQTGPLFQFLFSDPFDRTLTKPGSFSRCTSG